MQLQPTLQHRSRPASSDAKSALCTGTLRRTGRDLVSPRRRENSRKVRILLGKIGGISMCGLSGSAMKDSETQRTGHGSGWTIPSLGKSPA